MKQDEEESRFGKFFEMFSKPYFMKLSIQNSSHYLNFLIKIIKSLLNH